MGRHIRKGGVHELTERRSYITVRYAPRRLYSLSPSDQQDGNRVQRCERHRGDIALSFGRERPDKQGEYQILT